MYHGFLKAIADMPKQAVLKNKAMVMRTSTIFILRYLFMSSFIRAHANDIQAGRLGEEFDRPWIVLT